MTSIVINNETTTFLYNGPFLWGMAVFGLMLVVVALLELRKKVVKEAILGLFVALGFTGFMVLIIVWTFFEFNKVLIISDRRLLLKNYLGITIGTISVDARPTFQKKIAPRGPRFQINIITASGETFSSSYSSEERINDVIKQLQNQ